MVLSVVTVEIYLPGRRTVYEQFSAAGCVLDYAYCVSTLSAGCCNCILYYAGRKVLKLLVWLGNTAGDRVVDLYAGGAAGVKQQLSMLYSVLSSQINAV